MPADLEAPPDALVERLVRAAVLALVAAEGSAGMPARYDDLGRLGLGGMGEVGRVFDRELIRTCAYQVIHPDLAELVREARAAGSPSDAAFRRLDARGGPVGDGFLCDRTRAQWTIRLAQAS